MTSSKSLDESFRLCFLNETPSVQFKSLIQDEFQFLKQEFNPEQSVTTLLNHRSGFIDSLLKNCWDQFLGKLGKSLCLIATGGYGRSELFPYSDVDILILIHENQENYHEPLQLFSQFLWDIGLKPGQSVRTIEDCANQAANDQTIFTNLLDMRLITGNYALFGQLLNEFKIRKIWPSEKYLPAKIHEQELRHRKYHETAYNLEPNLKEGPGGIRDLQIISWVFKHHYHSKTLRGLIKYGYLPKSEYDNLVLARDKLWQLRFALHILTDHCEDRLLFDYQKELATQFGYVDPNNRPDVEQFMQFYFKTVLKIERLNEILLQLLNEKIISQNIDPTPLDVSDEFISINGYLESRSPDLFEKNPLCLLEIFLVLQRNPGLKGIRANTLRAISKNIKRIDDPFRANPKANRLFLEILKQPRNISEQLKQMNRYGILAAYLPDFANIVARMQYDLFHIYTVDEHTLFLVRNLRQFAKPLVDAELPFCNTVFRLIAKPEVLYLAGLFHDIGKGLGGDHSQLGEEIALRFCHQHQLHAHESKSIGWLVRNHLLMSMTAQRKDISDPDVIHSFAMHVGNIETLNYLYLLTVADIRATNPSLWNSWKDRLLKELYIATHNALHRGLKNPVVRSERINDNIKGAQQVLIRLGMDTQDIQLSWKHLSDDYFLRYSADEIAWHTIAIAGTEENELPLVLLRPETIRHSAEIFVYTKNERGIFSICTSSIDQVGLTILDARIITTSDQYVLNSFQVLEQSGEAINDLHREMHICTTLRQNLIKKQAIDSPRNIYKQSRQAQHFPIATQIEFLEDDTNPFTVMELITTDRAGLLSTIGKAFTELNIQLHDARITTIGSRAEDVFYISDQYSQPINDPNRKLKLQTTILKYLKPS